MSLFSFEDLPTCGYTFSNQYNGTIHYPPNTGHYDPNTHCQWVISVPVTMVIRLSLVRLDLEDSAGCQYDSIQVCVCVVCVKNCVLTENCTFSNGDFHSFLKWYRIEICVNKIICVFYYFPMNIKIISV